MRVDFIIKPLLTCDKFQEGTTPLILAAANNHIECVRELLKQGADGAARRLVSGCHFIAIALHKGFFFI